MSERIENKITRWYGKGNPTRVWLAKHWHRYITYGCAMCWHECKGHQNSNNATYSKGYGDIDSPKGFAEIAEYAYDNYGESFKS